MALVSLALAERCVLEERDGLVGADVLVVEQGNSPIIERHVTCGVTTHAICEDEQVRAGIPGVLVAGLEAETHVGARGIAQCDGHGSVRNRGTVLPMRRVVPTSTGCAGSELVPPDEGAVGRTEILDEQPSRPEGSGRCGSGAQRA